MNQANNMIESIELSVFGKSIENSTTAHKKPTYYYVKYIMDLILSLLLLPFILPIIFILGLLIKFSSKGSMFFSQHRLGQNGKLFKMYKLRSMHANAEDFLLNNPTLYKKYIKNNFKLNPEDDPRIFKLGKFLRKSSLDELPQIFNVIKGEMSLVGPRPILKKELNHYKDKKELFLSVKPGITGYWQVMGRSNINYPKRANIELEYVKKISFLTDLKILLLTPYVIFQKRGAY